MKASKSLATFPSLLGQRVFITGGGTGIGAAIVAAFAEQGAQVAFVDVAEKESAALAERLAQQGLPPVWWRTCDVRDVAALQQAVAQAQQELGDFSTLVNNVARDDRHTLESVTPEYWDERMAVNQRPAFFAIQAVVPGMRRLGGGSIVNLGSTGWQSKSAGYPCYAVAKSSVNGLTRGLADSLGADRIRINNPHQHGVAGLGDDGAPDRHVAQRRRRGRYPAQPVPPRQVATVRRGAHGLVSGLCRWRHVHGARVQGGRRLELVFFHVEQLAVNGHGRSLECPQHDMGGG